MYAIFLDFAEWNVQLYRGDGRLYTPVSFENLPTFIVLCSIAVVAYLVLCFFAERLAADCGFALLRRNVFGICFVCGTDSTTFRKFKQCAAFLAFSA